MRRTRACPVLVRSRNRCDCAGAQVGLLEEQVVAVVVLLPQRPAPRPQRAQRRGDQQQREAVHVEAVRPLAQPLRVLVGGMADLARLRPASAGTHMPS